MKFAIIDDHQIYLQILSERVSTVCKRYDIDFTIKCYDAPALLYDDNYLTSFDVVLLDIDMPHINGIELANKINRCKSSKDVPYIIFVSGMDHLVFEALNQFPYTFVRKSQLENLDKCILNIDREIKNSPAYSIKTGRTSVVVKIEKIICLEKEGNYVNFYTTDGVYQERSLIDDKQKDLAQYGFIRPHIGALVNANHIIEINSNHLRLSNSKEISISRTYKKETKEKYQEWLVRMK